jgi:hypothetical protein
VLSNNLISSSLLSSRFFTLTLLKEDANVIISDARVFIILSKGNNINNLKFIDVQLTRDENGLWIYDDSSTEWSVSDSVEYWLNVEVSNLGYFANKAVKVQGNHGAGKPFNHRMCQIKTMKI